MIFLMMIIPILWKMKASSLKFDIFNICSKKYNNTTYR